MAECILIIRGNKLLVITIHPDRNMANSIAVEIIHSEPLIPTSWWHNYKSALSILHAP